MTINSGAGNDIISNSNNSSLVAIKAGAGDDSIYNISGNVTIDSGTGKDSIENRGNEVSIVSGAGNDYIYNIGGNVTVDAGAGNDSIRLISSAQNLIKYKSGDGNDTIVSFNDNDTLSISGSTYTTQKSGNDVIVKVGKGTIKLENVYSNFNVIHINDETIEPEPKIISLAGGGDSIENSSDYVSIEGGTGDDSIVNSGSNVTINGGAGNDSIENYGGNSVSIDGGAGNDHIYNGSGDSITIDGGAGNDYIFSQSHNSSIFGGEGNDYITNNVFLNVTIDGGEGNDYIYNSGSNVTVNGGAGNDSIINWCNDNVTIDAGTGDDLINLYSNNLSYANLIKYSEGDGNDTIVGLNDDDTLSISGSTYTTQKSGNDVIVKVGDGNITLVDIADLSDINIEFTEKNSWRLDGTTAKYGTSSETLVIVKGVKSINGLSLKNNVVTVAKSSLNAKKVTVSNGYTLKLGSDVTGPTTKKAAWSLKNSTATYKSSYKTAGYTLASDEKSISYSKATTAKTLATIKGVKSIDGLKVSGTTITVSKASLNAKNVTVSDGYTLKLGSNVTKSTTKGAWSLKSSTATYNQTTTAGYSLENNSIVYSKAATTKTMATVKGVKSTSGLSVKNDVVTLKNSALTNKVTVSGGYEFDFASDYTKATITGSDSNDTITARGKNISIGSGKGDDAIKLINAGLVKGGAGADIINGGSGKDSIYGEAGNDKLYGGKGNDSLWGGAGNDSLWGDDGKDTFIYKPGEGTDTIFDYANGDMLKILTKNGKEGGAFTSSEYSDGTLTLAISGGGSVVFDGVSESSKFNINNATYKISSSKLTASK